jgi:hypothetical protein
MTTRGVFVYRTIGDLEQIMAYAKRVQRCAVIGGGLLGLEAAKAAYDLGLETHVIEFAPRLMPRQVDDAGSRILVKKIEGRLPDGASIEDNGYIINWPAFGKIILGEILIGPYVRRVTLVRLKHSDTEIGSGCSGGSTWP